MATTKTSFYTVRALFRRKKNGVMQYEWKELRDYGLKKLAVDYAKRQSSITYRDGRTGRYLVQKVTNEAMYESGKIVK